MRSRNTAKILGLALAAALLAACAESRPAAQASLTAADVPAANAAPVAPATAPSPAEATPQASEATAAPTAAAPALPTPAGRRECKATSPFGVSSELYLEWNGSSATGVLRSVAPTGAVTDKIVSAERHDGTIFVDDPNLVDLVTHVALLRNLSGAQHLRFGDEKTWLRCE